MVSECQWRKPCLEVLQKDQQPETTLPSEEDELLEAGIGRKSYWLMAGRTPKLSHLTSNRGAKEDGKGYHRMVE